MVVCLLCGKLQVIIIFVQEVLYYFSFKKPTVNKLVPRINNLVRYRLVLTTKIVRFY